MPIIDRRTVDSCSSQAWRQDKWMDYSIYQSSEESNYFVREIKDKNEMPSAGILNQAYNSDRAPSSSHDEFYGW